MSESHQATMLVVMLLAVPLSSFIGLARVAIEINAELYWRVWATNLWG